MKKIHMIKNETRVAYRNGEVFATVGTIGNALMQARKQKLFGKDAK